jgi:hypothetical protein
MAAVTDRRYKRMIAHLRRQARSQNQFADLRGTRFGRDNLGDVLLPAAI